MEAWSNGEERCSCAEPTLRYIPKLDRLLGALPCPEKGKAMQGDGVVRPVSSSSPPGVERWAVLGSPLCFSPGWGVQGLWRILPPALCMDWKCSFTVVLSWGRPETLPGWHVLVGEERTEVLTKTGRQDSNSGFLFSLSEHLSQPSYRSLPPQH